MTEAEAPWTAPDGSMLGHRVWRPEQPASALVIAIHGLGCRAEDFEPLASILNAGGIALAAWNLRGQGLDPMERRRGAWLETTGFLEDLRAFERFVNPRGLPLFLAGESMGALLALKAANEASDVALRGLLLFAPVAALAQENPAWLKMLLRGAARIFPRQRLRPGWFVHGSSAMPPLTRIEERQRYLASAPHRLGPLTLRFLANLGDLIDSSMAEARKLRVPVAVFSGGCDVFTTADQFSAFFSALGSADKTHFRYEQGYHQLLFDLDADRVVADAAGWLVSRRSR